jgi:hypothetical protein
MVRHSAAHQKYPPAPSRTRASYLVRQCCPHSPPSSQRSSMQFSMRLRIHCEFFSVTGVAPRVYSHQYPPTPAQCIERSPPSTHPTSSRCLHQPGHPIHDIAMLPSVQRLMFIAPSSPTTSASTVRHPFKINVCTNQGRAAASQPHSKPSTMRRE